MYWHTKIAHPTHLQSRRIAYVADPERIGESPIGRELPEPDKKINQSCDEEIALKMQFLIDRSRRMTEESNGKRNPPCSEEIPLAIQFLTKVLTERHDR